MIYKYKVWNGREMVSPDYITRNGIAFWKEDSIQCSSPKIVQFTGVLDRNGKEIYQGDLVKFGGRTHIVQYTQKRDVNYGQGDCTESLFAGFLIGSSYGSDNEIEVVGNIYANPDALEL